MYGRDLLSQIKADGKTDRLSENLMKWVKRYMDRQLFVAIATEGKRVFDATLTQAAYLYIGYGNLEDGYLMGSRLSEILCNGASTSTFAYHGLKFVEVPEWWNLYIQHGKCCIDPEHALYMDNERWQVSENGKSRKCLWCNGFIQYECVELIPRTSWGNYPVGE